MANTRPAWGTSLGRSPTDTICGWGRCRTTIPSDAEVPLCREHHYRAWQTWQETEVAAVHAASDARQVARPVPEPDERVYFLRFGDRIKIGYTANIAQRLRAVPHDDVLLVLPGTRLLERQVHACFAHLRITGEWFRADPELTDWIGSTQPS